MKRFFTTFVIFLKLSFVFGQEFPIATGTDTTFAMSASFDGTNYLIAIKGNNQSADNATAQIVSSSGTLVGSRIFIGSNVSSRGILSAFDGTNYLLVWGSNSGNIIGHFISPGGSLVGTEFLIATNGSLDRESTLLSFHSGSYFVAYIKGSGNSTYLWGREISTSGNLGNEVLISNSTARDASISFDGVKYILAYVENTSLSKNDIYARFVSTSGVLIGNEITVASGNYQRDNPTSLAFDGDKFLLAYHEQDPNVHQWFLYGRFIDTVGNVQSNFLICDSSYHPMIAMVSFGDNEYLISWTQETNASMMGQFYDKTGNQSGSPFVIFNTLDNKFPLGGTIYANNNFLAISTRLDFDFTDGDVYGKFITSHTGLSDATNLDKVLVYPNPATDFITLTIDIVNNSDLKLNIYNTMGTLVKYELFNQNTFQVNIADLVDGIYIVEIKSKEWNGKQKLIIQR